MINYSFYNCELTFIFSYDWFSLLFQIWNDFYSALVLVDLYWFESFSFSCCLLFTYSLFTDLPGQKGLYFLTSLCLALVSFVCKIPLHIFCSAAFVVINSFRFSLWDVIISPSIRKDILLDKLDYDDFFFPSGPELCLHMTFLCLEFVIQMGLPLYVTYMFSFAAFSSLSLFSMLSV
jgi:hypothetical protein